MGIFKTIFDKESVVDGLDKVVLTDEERLDYHKELLKAYEPFKLIQRFLAVMIGFSFMFILLLTTVMFIYGQYGPNKELYGNVAMDFSNLEVIKNTGWAFLSVVSLYFTGGILNGWKSK